MCLSGTKELPSDLDLIEKYVSMVTKAIDVAALRHKLHVDTQKTFPGKYGVHLLKNTAQIFAVIHQVLQSSIRN